MKLLGDFFTQFQVLVTLRVRYHDKAVMVGEVITVVSACVGRIILQRVGKIAQITRREGVLTIEQLKGEYKTRRRV
jgi:hypothetical protein